MPPPLGSLTSVATTGSALTGLVPTGLALTGLVPMGVGLTGAVVRPGTGGRSTAGRGRGHGGLQDRSPADGRWSRPSPWRSPPPWRWPLGRWARGRRAAPLRPVRPPFVTWLSPLLSAERPLGANRVYSRMDRPPTAIGGISLCELVTPGHSTRPESSAVQAHRMNTAGRWPWPSLIRR